MLRIKYVYCCLVLLTCPSIIYGVVQLMAQHVHLHPVYHQPREEQVSLVVDRLLVLVGDRAVH